MRRKMIRHFKNNQKLIISAAIIGGIIKSYEYRMIPYILAENPKIKNKEASIFETPLLYSLYIK